MRRLGLTGASSTIAKAFTALTPYEATVAVRDPRELPVSCDDYLLCAGMLCGKPIGEMAAHDISETIRVNFSNVAAFCDELFEQNDTARVCVIGSASGINGSYDMAYAGAKAALHLYVETKRLRTAQQHLVCVAPAIIEDSGMTQRRTDLQPTLERGAKRRLGRWLHAEEIARIANFALNEPALCNTVINAQGGNW